MSKLVFHVENGTLRGTWWWYALPSGAKWNTKEIITPLQTLLHRSHTN